jgi:hypothetical protein
VTQAQLDDHVRRYLRTLFAFGVFDRSAYAEEEARIERAAHAAAARKIEEGAITLLQNKGQVLPLDAAHVKSIAVIGKPAGSFISGGGSSAVKPYSAVTPLQGITERAGPGVHVAFDEGSSAASAVALARSSDVAIVVAANYETEGADLNCLSLECPHAYGEQDSLIEQVAAANPKTIVVLETGGPVLTPWRGQVSGLLASRAARRSPAGCLAMSTRAGTSRSPSPRPKRRSLPPATCSPTPAWPTARSTGRGCPSAIAGSTPTTYSPPSRSASGCPTPRSHTAA